MRHLMQLPNNLPVPKDDGACIHLAGMEVPDVQLETTKSRFFNLRAESEKPTVIFFYPRTGEPGEPAPPDWDIIPGARGCTPQSCGFKDLFKEFKSVNVQVYGASSQDSVYQKEFVERMHIPFEILSDRDFQLTEALKLPTFTYNGMRLIKRLALLIDKRTIGKVFYPVFPPNENASTVLDWIKTNRINEAVL
jgi:peroxiredoxin